MKHMRGYLPSCFVYAIHTPPHNNEIPSYCSTHGPKASSSVFIPYYSCIHLIDSRFCNSVCERIGLVKICPQCSVSRSKIRVFYFVSLYGVDPTLLLLRPVRFCLTRSSVPYIPFGIVPNNVVPNGISEFTTPTFDTGDGAVRIGSSGTDIDKIRTPNLDAFQRNNHIIRVSISIPVIIILITDCCGRIIRRSSCCRWNGNADILHSLLNHKIIVSIANLRIVPGSSGSGEFILHIDII